MAKETVASRLEALKTEALAEYTELKARYDKLTAEYKGYGWIQSSTTSKPKTPSIKIAFDKLKSFLGTGSKHVSDIAKEFDISERSASQQTRQFAKQKLVKKDEAGNVKLA